MALLRLRNKALDYRSFADAGFTADESYTPLAGDGLMQPCAGDQNLRAHLHFYDCEGGVR